MLLHTGGASDTQGDPTGIVGCRQVNCGAILEINQPKRFAFEQEKVAQVKHSIRLRNPIGQWPNVECLYLCSGRCYVPKNDSDGDHHISRIDHSIAGKIAIDNRRDTSICERSLYKTIATDIKFTSGQINRSRSSGRKSLIKKEGDINTGIVPTNSSSYKFDRISNINGMRRTVSSALV
jgi:hypothetical protein